jgi:hypothetical protein
MGTCQTERGGFEPPVEFDPHAALAKRCYRPLSHLSCWVWTDDIYSRRADESKADLIASQGDCQIQDDASSVVDASGAAVSVALVLTSLSAIPRTSMRR